MSVWEMLLFRPEDDVCVKAGGSICRLAAACGIFRGITGQEDENEVQ